MDLTTGSPFWPIRDGLLATYPPLERDVRCDVAIIGGGMTGGFVALALAEAGVDVILLDKRDVATGSTASCTGLLQYEIDTPLHELIDRIGRDKAVRSYLLCLAAIDKLDRMTKATLGDACGFARRKSLYLASSPVTSLGSRRSTPPASPAGSGSTCSARATSMRSSRSKRRPRCCRTTRERSTRIG